MVGSRLNFKSTVHSYLDTEVRKLPEGIGDFPYYTTDGHWERLANLSADDWVAGFYPGVFWLGSLVNEEMGQRAYELTQHVDEKLSENFNTGFRYQYSHLINYELNGDSDSYKKCLKAARRLLECFHGKSGLFCHLRQGKPLIAATDLYMNLPLLYWAADNDPMPLEVSYRDCVKSSLDRAGEVFAKEDGGVRHLLKIDRTEGRIISEESPQGIDGGCWARGLAWLYRGLLAGGVYFENQDYVDRARQLVSYHNEQSHGLIPPFDYKLGRRPNNSELDTTAAAILAGGLLIDGILLDNKAALELGEKTLKEMFSRYSRGLSEAGLIDGGCYHYPRNLGVESATVWGDYYTLEALYMLEYKSPPPYCSWLLS